MQTNAVPHIDLDDRPTGCCARFDPEGWDGIELHFRDKPFVRATTRSAAHVPLDMGRVFARVHRHIEAAGGHDPDNTVVLSRDLSPWSAEHLFAVSHPVPGEEQVALSGDFRTKVFEGPYRDAGAWMGEMKQIARAHGREGGRMYLFYTTCPNCAKAYGRNYVVGIVEV